MRVKAKVRRTMSLLVLASILVCEPMSDANVNAAVKPTKVTLSLSKSKSYKVSKSWGRWSEIHYTYPDADNKARVTVNISNNKLKIRGLSAGKVKVTVKFKKKKKVYSVTVKGKKDTSGKDSMNTNTIVDTSTITPGEKEDIKNLTDINGICSFARVNKFEYTDTSIEIRDYDNDGIPNSFFFTSMNLKNVSNEQLKLEAHVKFYDKDGNYLCRYQLSEDIGTNVNRVLEPKENYILFMFTASWKGGLDKDTASKIKYWRFDDV